MVRRNLHPLPKTCTDFSGLESNATRLSLTDTAAWLPPIARPGATSRYYKANITGSSGVAGYLGPFYPVVGGRLYGWAPWIRNDSVMAGSDHVFPYLDWFTAGFSGRGRTQGAALTAGEQRPTILAPAPSDAAWVRPACTAIGGVSGSVIEMHLGGALLQPLSDTFLDQFGAGSARVHDTFTAKPDGPLVRADSGHTYDLATTVGLPQATLHIVGGRVVNTTDVAAAGYAEIELPNVVSKIGGRFTLTAHTTEQAAAGLVVWKFPISDVPADITSPCHFGMLAAGYNYTTLDADGSFPFAAAGAVTALTADDATVSQAEILIAGARACVKLPDGTLVFVEDPSIAENAGRWANLEIAPHNIGTDPDFKFTEWWADDFPVEIPDVADYFDGDDTGHEWSGAQNASVSYAREDPMLRLSQLAPADELVRVMGASLR